MPSDPRLDALYQLPLAEFTTARNALAKTLRGADAAHIKALAKPTVVPWAINQLYWRDRRTYDRVMKAGEALRRAQIALLQGHTADVRRAADVHRSAVADAVHSATTLAKAQGANPAADQLARMLEAVSLSPTPPSAPGRFTELIQPSGFEALAGITPAGAAHRPAPPPRVETPAPARHRGGALTAAQERQRDAQRKHEEAQRAREAAERKRQAEAAVRTAERDVAATQAAAVRAQRDVEHAEQALASARAAQEQAAKAREAAERELTRAKGALAITP